MGLENVNRCRHVKVNGTQCGSPALRRRRLCFFHVRCQEQTARIAGREFGQARFVVPLLEDANAVQLALMQVMQLLGSGQMDHRMAGLMLYALPTASVNLRNTRFEPTDVTDVVIDRGTVDATCIGGPQWDEDDFEDEGDSENEGEEEAEIAAEGAENGAEEPEERVGIDEARRQVQKAVMDWVVETVQAEAGRPGSFGWCAEAKLKDKITSYVKGSGRGRPLHTSNSGFLTGLGARFGMTKCEGWCSRFMFDVLLALVRRLGIGRAGLGLLRAAASL